MNNDKIALIRKDETILAVEQAPTYTELLKSRSKPSTQKYDTEIEFYKHQKNICYAGAVTSMIIMILGGLVIFMLSV